MLNTDPFAATRTDHLRVNTAQLAESATAVITQIDHIGTQVGCQRVSWSWTNDYSYDYRSYDYRNPKPERPVLSGLVGGKTAAARQATLQWANVLGLAPAAKPNPGTVAYEGEIDGLKVKLWAVVDNAAFGGKFATLKMYVPDALLTGMLVFTTAAVGVLLARHNRLAKAIGR